MRFMFSSSSSFSPSPLPVFLNRKPNSITLISSLLSSPNLKKPNSRKNHLRPKLPPNPLPHSPPPILPNQKSEFDNSEHQTSEHKTSEYEPSVLEEPEYKPSSDHIFLHESVHELNLDSQSPNPNIKSFIFDVSFRFAALIAVQTAVAVWIFSQRDGREQKIVNEKEKDVDVMYESDVNEGADLVFERAVLEIRNMAKDARVKEAKEIEEEEVEKESLFLKSERPENKNGNGKLGERKKLKFVRSNVGRKNAGKGFNGGAQQIIQQNQRQSMDLTLLTENSTDIDSFSILLNEKPSHIVGLQKTIDHKATPPNHKPGNVNKRVKTRPMKSVGYNHVDSSFVSSKKPWWLKLQYVLGILMRRSPDRNSPKGLYSLETSSPLNSGRDPPSYTITFQDHADATHFCYLLESFFEELDGFSADIVPLTIKELEEQMKLDDMRFVVVKKGQLQIYAGQPLAEVEIALRSLIH